MRPVNKGSPRKPPNTTTGQFLRNVERRVMATAHAHKPKKRRRQQIQTNEGLRKGVERDSKQPNSGSANSQNRILQNHDAEKLHNANGRTPT